MATEVPRRRDVLAAWSVAVPAAAVSLGTVVVLVLAGPFALLALPLVLPPLLVLVAQSRVGLRVGRRRPGGTGTLCLLTVVVAVVLGVLAVVARPEDGGGPDGSNAALGAAAVLEAVAAVVLAPSALRSRRRPEPARIVGLALAALATAQVAVLLLPRPSDSPLP